MSQIGQFTRLRGLFTGRIRTLLIDRHIVLVPCNPSNPNNGPHYSVHLTDSDGPEVGAGWKRTGDRAGDYVSLFLDDPSLPGPIRARLFQQDEAKKIWVLIWNRDTKRDDTARAGQSEDAVQ